MVESLFLVLSLIRLSLADLIPSTPYSLLPLDSSLSRADPTIFSIAPPQKLQNLLPRLKKRSKLKENPLLIFVNKESGGRQGSSILKSLEKVHPKDQICDLSRQTPSEFLSRYQHSSEQIRLLCCGGDGTVNWILKELRKLNMSQTPLAVIPMGTGNDLVRTLESSYFPNQVNSVSPSELCKDPMTSLNRFRSKKTECCEIDLWNASIYPLLNLESPSLHSHPPDSFSSASLLAQSSPLLSSSPPSLNKIMVNYCSIGLDGAVSLAFDRLRKTRPDFFFSSLMNKAWYGLLGTRIFFTEKLHDLSKSQVTVTCDGRTVAIPPGTEGLIILSVSSYMGGTKIWPPTGKRAWLRSVWNGKKRTENEERDWTVPSASDGILEVRIESISVPFLLIFFLEVVAVGNMVHLGIIKTGLSKGLKVAQGRRIEIINPHLSPMQVDGEPWLQEPCKMILEKTGRSDALLFSLSLLTTSRSVQILIPESRP
jgi:diacylglycerol kinase (ATP)